MSDSIEERNIVVVRANDKFGTSLKGWIGVDLDGTLAYYGGWPLDGSIGPAIPLMLQQVKQWIEEGKIVKIFTARVSMPDADEQRAKIQVWCRENGLPELEVTCVKDIACLEIYDDRAVQVIMNTGIPVRIPVR